ALTRPASVMRLLAPCARSIAASREEGEPVMTSTGRNLMSFDRSAWTSYGSTTLFVLLWSGGAIFAKWGLFHASAFAFLLLRFILAMAALLLICARRRRWLPEPGTRGTVAATGLLL